MTPLVINLDRNPERLTHMERELGRIGVGFERVAGSDLSRLPPREIEALQADYGTRGHYQPLARGQIGNLLSHAEAWRRIAEGSEAWGIVMEDDLHVAPILRDLLQTDEWLPRAAQIVRLETTGQGMKLGRRHRYPFREVELEFAEIHGPAWGSAAYAIERTAACWLAATPLALLSPTDFLMFNKGTPIADALSVWQLVPAPCVQDKYHPIPAQRVGFGSDTETGPPARSYLHEMAVAISKRAVRPLLGKIVVEVDPAMHTIRPQMQQSHS